MQRRVHAKTKRKKHGKQTFKITNDNMSRRDYSALCMKQYNSVLG